jgi:hypothetical protein
MTGVCVFDFRPGDEKFAVPHNLNRVVAHLPDILTTFLPSLNPAFTCVRYASSW